MIIAQFVFVIVVTMCLYFYL